MNNIPLSIFHGEGKVRQSRTRGEANARTFTRSMNCKNQLLTTKGFATCSSCNCGGVYSEKWSGFNDYRVRLVANKTFYLYKGNQFIKQGGIENLEQTLIEL